jgi:hypothetical protein
MQVDVLSKSTLEELYEKVILPQFGIVGAISWEDHFSIGPDSHAHVFVYGQTRLVLVYDDYPTTDAKSLTEDFPGSSIKRIALDDAGSDVTVEATTTLAPDDYVLRFGPGSLPFKWVYNVTGYFQLFTLG